MKKIIAANSEKAAVLTEVLDNAEFVSLKALPDRTVKEKVLLVPCFIYGGEEYKRAVGRLREVYADAEVLPPLISSTEDYFYIKSLLTEDKHENALFCMHRSTALDIRDENLWKIGDDTSGAIAFARKRAYNKIYLYMLMINPVYHFKNDIQNGLIADMKREGVDCVIKLRSVFDSAGILNLYKRRTEEHETD